MKANNGSSLGFGFMLRVDSHWTLAATLIVVGAITNRIFNPANSTAMIAMMLARQGATIDALSNGRFTLGIGIGVRENDYLATGFDFHRRGRRVEEQLSIMRRLWAGEPLSAELGAIGPPAKRAGGPELLIGGYVPAVAWRIARWADGYMAPGGSEPESMQEMWQHILRAWSEEGRAGRPRWVGASYYALGPRASEHAARYINANYGDNPQLATRRLGSLPATIEAVAEAISRQADMGVDEFILRLCAEDLDQMDRLSEVAAAHS